MPFSANIAIYTSWERISSETKFKRYIYTLKSYPKLKLLLLSPEILKISKKSDGMVYAAAWMEDAQVIGKLPAL